MLISLTQAGVDLINAATAPVVVTAYRLGDAYNYVPQLTDTNLHGNVVYSGVPPDPLIITADLIKYGVVLDYDLPNHIDFGEIGYFVGTTLFALGANATMLHKIPQVTGTDGNAIRIDAYLSMVGTAYNMWGDVAESNNRWQLATLSSVDRLPKSADAVPNSYVITGADAKQSAFLAYTDRNGLWCFDAYAFANSQEVPILSATSTSVTIDRANYNTDMNPAYFGMNFVEFASGVNYSLCRYIQSVGFNGQQVTFNFNSPMATVPAIGDSIMVFGRQWLSTTNVNLPIATATQLGGVKIGTGIAVTADGTISIDPTVFPVTSVNGKTGVVVITPDDIPGLATVAKTNNYDDLDNKPPSYLLPVATASILGGVRAPTTGRGLSISSTGVIDLDATMTRSVNGVTPDPITGNIVLNVVSQVIGLVTPTEIPLGGDLNTMQASGLFFIQDANVSSIANIPSGVTSGATIDIEPFTTTASGGDVIQRWQGAAQQFFRRYAKATDTWTPWVASSQGAAPAVATKTSLGVMQVGAGLNVTGLGVVSTQIQSINGKTDQNVMLTAPDVGAIGDVPTTPPDHVWGRKNGAWVDLSTFTFDAGTF